LGLIKENEENLIRPGFAITGFNGATSHCPMLVTRWQFGRHTNKFVTAMLCVVPIDKYKLIVGQDFLLPLSFKLEQETLILNGAVTNSGLAVRLRLLTMEEVV
jgi:hypothetical protein